jgi:hypothetical protein
MKNKTRRRFLQESIGLGAAGGALLAAGPGATSAASYSRVLGANDRIRVALIG